LAETETAEVALPRKKRLTRREKGPKLVWIGEGDSGESEVERTSRVYQGM